MTMRVSEPANGNGHYWSDPVYDRRMHVRDAGILFDTAPFTDLLFTRRGAMR